MKITEIAFTAYPVTDIARARHFYETVLGLAPGQVWEEGAQAWVEYEIGPGTLAITNFIPDWKPATSGGCVSLELEDFDQALADLKAAGVACQVPPATPVCRMIFVQDPDGNGLMLHKRHPAPHACCCGGECH